MSFRKMIALGAFGALSAVASVAGASSKADVQEGTGCLSSYRLGGVAPYQRQESTGYGESVLAGASVFVYAQPGLTAEWLQYQLQQGRAAGAPASSCPIEVQGARVSVQAGGPGFWVTVSSNDAKDAKEILRRAQLLAH